MDNHAAIDGIKTPMVPPLRTPMNYLYNICHYFYSYSDDWSNSNADRVGEAVRRHWTEICRQWQTVGVLYQTHHGTCMVPSQTAPSAPRSSPDLHYRTFVIINHRHQLYLHHSLHHQRHGAMLVFTVKEQHLRPLMTDYNQTVR